MTSDLERQSSMVVEALRRSGLEVESVNDVINSRATGITIDDPQVDALIDVLGRVDNLRVKESIVRCLTDRKASRPDAMQALVSEFVGTVTGESIFGADGMVSDSFHYKWAVGNAIGTIARKSDGPVLERLASERGHGRAREMIVPALGRLKSPHAYSILTPLLSDADVTGHAVIGLRLLRDPRALGQLEPFLQHENEWIRREAKKAIRRRSPSEATS